MQYASEVVSSLDFFDKNFPSGEILHLKLHVPLSGDKCKISYGFGSIVGFFSQDNIQVGDLIVKDQVSSFSQLLSHQYVLSVDALLV